MIKLEDNTLTKKNTLKKYEKLNIHTFKAVFSRPNQ